MDNSSSRAFLGDHLCVVDQWSYKPLTGRRLRPLSAETIRLVPGERLNWLVAPPQVFPFMEGN
jgi:hypothetical protein